MTQKTHKFANCEGGSLNVHYDGDEIHSDAARKMLVVLDPDDQIVVFYAAERRHLVLDDDLQLQDHLDGGALQDAHAKLRKVRAERGLR